MEGQHQELMGGMDWQMVKVGILLLVNLRLRPDGMRNMLDLNAAVAAILEKKMWKA